MGTDFSVLSGNHCSDIFTLLKGKVKIGGEICKTSGVLFVIPEGLYVFRRGIYEIATGTIVIPEGIFTFLKGKIRTTTGCFVIPLPEFRNSKDL